MLVQQLAKGIQAFHVGLIIKASGGIPFKKNAFHAVIREVRHQLLHVSLVIRKTVRQTRHNVKALLPQHADRNRVWRQRFDDRIGTRGFKHQSVHCAIELP
ncbi:Uncharacterised protein [Actinobacillus pleuropneumoniae]|nr:Uncharacterised protein [Actinobacillus pleuropneumoniae]